MEETGEGSLFPGRMCIWKRRPRRRRNQCSTLPPLPPAGIQIGLSFRVAPAANAKEKGGGEGRLWPTFLPFLPFFLGVRKRGYHLPSSCRYWYPTLCFLPFLTSCSRCPWPQREVSPLLLGIACLRKRRRRVPSSPPPPPRRGPWQKERKERRGNGTDRPISIQLRL